ncbi:WD repeat-containing protein 18 [Neodiprion pinetum]|uniref:WD repeat-containing protein 18 n=1 Tax=Neodiprion lecontei TaxID=441921 RepID=A0A6J0C473_NEOLC|nr:WD repeat-containing protein 18 [Neodiprion lecontei]XP_046488533.1 WD repeat-containing protein 18 [Neodiprion pinetum]
MSSLSEMIITSDGSGLMFSAAAWDPQTGTQLATYKNGTSLGYNTTNILADSYLIGADATKPRLYFWPLNKQTPVENMRFVAPGTVTALTCSPDGLFIAAAVGEKLCIWQTSTGVLLAVVSRHYQTVTSLKFTSDGSTLISGGDDGLVFVWSLSSVVSRTENNTGTRQAASLYSFSDHSLAVKDLFIGRFGIQARLVTVSLDCTAKIYDLDSGTLLLSLVFGVPLTSASMDLRESYLFVGCTTGEIFQFNLHSPPRGREHHVNQTEEALTFKGHIKAVTCLSVSTDCTSLLSGSADGFVNIWHIPSRQILRTIPHKGPVTAAFFTRAVNNFFTNDLRPKLVLHSLQRNADADSENDVIEVVNSCREQDLLNAEIFFSSNDVPSDGSDAYAELQKAQDEIKALKATNAQLYKYGVKLLMK